MRVKCIQGEVGNAFFQIIVCSAVLFVGWLFGFPPNRDPESAKWLQPHGLKSNGQQIKMTPILAVIISLFFTTVLFAR